ncbi:hypothetical protein [Enterococcus casseliflavus]|uniref:hypothetical protein n=1 Tax=Enterococcus casseliflavus TaxID=37734 RepID=UPI001E2888B4|nr:hypothetical protein [Enterococcus casseliflavus]MCD4962535.1 hypothetical protein [Enterococcus casseliflavus]
MKRLVRVSICAYSVLFLLLYTSKEAIATFLSEKRIDTNITLTAGYLSLDIKAEQDNMLFTDEITSQSFMLQVQNTGTLEGKVSFEIKSITFDNRIMTLEELSEYIELTDLNQIDKIAAGESKTATLVLKRKKTWSDKTPIKITIQSTISQVNLVNDTTGFLDRKETTISLNCKSTITSWPENLTFNQAGYAVGQQMYYSTVDNKYTTVVPGIIFIKYKNNQMISLKEQDETETKLKNAIHIVQSGNFNYVLKSIEYVAQEGFKLQLGIENSVVDTKFTVAGIKFDYIDNHLTDSQFDDFCKPLILESDVDRTNTYTNNPLYSSTIGTNYQMFSNKQTNTFSYGLTSAEIGNYVNENFDVEFIGSDAKKFEVSFLKNSMIHVKQLDTEGGKKAQLIFKDKMTKQIVFSREVISVDQEEFSDIDLSNLISDFQTTVVNKTAKQQANVFKVSTDFYMKIPENFLSHYYLQPFSNSSMSGFSVSYSNKMDYVKISFDYSYTNQPDTIEQMIVFLGYQFGFGSTTSEKSYTLYHRTDYGSSSASDSTDSIQMQQKSNAKSASGISEDIEDTNDSQQNATQESEDTQGDSEKDTDIRVSDSISENQPDSSTTVTTESTESTTNQTEPSQEPE